MINDAITAAISREIMLVLVILVSAFMAGLGFGWFAGRTHPIQPPVCPPCDAQPFCQVMGSPVGGRMAQLPEGVGPHD